MSHILSNISDQLHSLFLLQPVGVWKLEWWYAGFVIIGLIVALLSIFLKKWIHPTLRTRLINWGWTQFLIGIVLFFSRYYSIPYLGMDALRTIQEIAAYIWLIFIVRYALTSLPKRVIKEQAELRRNKYLPK